MRKSFIIILFLPLLLAAQAYADIGPKATVDIYVNYNSGRINDNLFYARMLGCDTIVGLQPERIKDAIIAQKFGIKEFDPVKNCYWQPAALAWGGECRYSSCHFSYHPPSLFRLAVYVPSLEKTFISGEVERKNFHSNYYANLLSSGTIEIRETTLASDALRIFVIALFITLTIELLVVFIYMRRGKDYAEKYSKFLKRVLSTVSVANIISFPLVWFIIPSAGLSPINMIILAEIFAVLFEGALLHFVNRNLFPLKKALILSFLMNAASFFIGGFIFLVFLFIFG
ncbi:MAG: hypothetical protein HYX24_01140 [Candidatus Aenigmarchaeota archaeon]|nr:hypothetical protein [Candidatus Aenigmarchaeota archaeon]